MSRQLDRRQFLYATILAGPWSCRQRHSAGDGRPLTSVASSLPANRPEPPPKVTPLHPDALARYVDSLPIPPVLAPAGQRPDPRQPHRTVDYFRVTMRETEGRVHRDLPPTRFWSYSGTVPGPTFETRSGRPLLIEWQNALPTEHFLPIDHTLCGAGKDQPEVRAVVHVHGARVPPESDGYPEDWTVPGASQTAIYPNQQDAAMLWYHDHAMGIERLNQYAGLLGVFFVRDAVEDALALPSGPHEVPLVLFDRLFDAGGRLVYPTSGDPQAPWVPEVYGDAILVNGKLFPYLEVEPRPYRFRVLNASNTRFFFLSLSNRTHWLQIGTDQGLLPAPVSVERVTLAPAERADLVVDFSGQSGSQILLKSHSFELLQFRVSTGPSPSAAALPPRLRALQRIPPSAAVKTRSLTLGQYMQKQVMQGHCEGAPDRMLMLLNGKRWHDPITETPQLGAVEIWQLFNFTEDTHPIHVHMVRFQVLERQKFDADEYKTSGKLILIGEPVLPAPNEAGWKDTVQADPGLVTRIIVRFEGYKGRYVWHCHVLEHAANEMMRPFEVI